MKAQKWILKQKKWTLKELFAEKASAVMEKGNPPRKLRKVYEPIQKGYNHLVHLHQKQRNIPESAKLSATLHVCACNIPDNLLDVGKLSFGQHGFGK